MKRCFFCYINKGAFISKLKTHPFILMALSVFGFVFKTGCVRGHARKNLVLKFISESAQCKGYCFFAHIHLNRSSVALCVIIDEYCASSKLSFFISLSMPVIR